MFNVCMSGQNLRTGCKFPTPHNITKGFVITLWHCGENTIMPAMPTSTQVSCVGSLNTKLQESYGFLTALMSARVILSGEPWFISHGHHQAGTRGYHIVEQPRLFCISKENCPKLTKMATLQESQLLKEHEILWMICL